jgi:hypothetical protein
LTLNLLQLRVLELGASTFFWHDNNLGPESAVAIAEVILIMKLVLISISGSRNQQKFDLFGSQQKSGWTIESKGVYKEVKER